MSTLNIKDAETHRLATELARRTGETLTAAVRQAVRERLERERRRDKSERKRILKRVDALTREIAALPVLDSRPVDEILGYNDMGTFD